MRGGDRWESLELEEWRIVRQREDRERRGHGSDEGWGGRVRVGRVAGVIET